MKLVLSLCVLLAVSVQAQFAPSANQAGTSAIHKDSSVIVNWAFAVTDFQRGPQDIAVGTPLADFGDSTAALGYAEGNSSDVVSLGDKGSITLMFQFPIENGAGADFAIFENSFTHDYLEFAHVEVSTDGVNFVRLPSESVIQNVTQTGPFANSIASEVYNLAGKYIQAYGTPFDLEDIIDSTGINLDSINYVKIIDVVGSIDPSFGTQDNLGNYINDPYPTAFSSGGFDLDAVAVINENNIFASVPIVDFSFVVYPNPTAGNVNIEFKGYQFIRILDVTGKVIYEGHHQDYLSLDLISEGFSTGIYIIEVGGVRQKLILK